MDFDLSKLDLAALKIVQYPDPRLRTKAAPIDKPDATVAALARRMFELMRAGKGVGLAAPQVGVPLRMFVMNATEDPANDAVIINPEILDAVQIRESEEGCLSIPDVRVNVRRPSRCRLVARNLKGERIEMDGEDLPARVWQHETDHLNGVLIIDRMSPSDKIAVRKKLKELEDKFKKAGK